MGLFFMSGGYTYHYRRNWLLKNIKFTLIPYLLWAIIGLIFNIVIDVIKADYITIDITSRLLRTITGIAANNYPLWFLVAFFVSRSMYDLINQWLNSDICKSWKIAPIVLEIAFVLLLSIAGYLYSIHKPFGHSILRFDTGFIMLPLFTVGRYTPLLFAHTKTIVTYILAVSLFMALNIVSGIMLNQLVSVNSNEYRNIFLFFVSTITGTLAIFLICKAIAHFPHAGTFLSYIGANSLIILCCHYFFLYAISAVRILLLGDIQVCPIVQTVLCLMLLMPSLPFLNKITQVVQNRLVKPLHY